MTPKTTLHPGKQPNSRTNDAENNTPFGKTTQFPDGQQKNNMMENEFWKEKAFWKDMLWFALVLGIIYVVYVTIEYWPEITEGFNRGWNSR